MHLLVLFLIMTFSSIPHPNIVLSTLFTTCYVQTTIIVILHWKLVCNFKNNVLTRIPAPRRKLCYKISGFIGASVAEAFCDVLPIASHTVYMTDRCGSWFQGLPS
jgi:hypothetical protein